MNSSTPRQPLAFYHADGMVPAWEIAMMYAGDGGRLATIPDLIDARLQTKFPDPPWSQYFVTTSAEYFGIGSDGRRKMIVAHGIGPMSTLDGVKKAYSWEYRDKDRSRNGGRISQEEFWKLEAGKYGEVSIIDFDEYFSFPRPLRSHEPYQFGVKRFTEARDDELLAARLGPRAQEFIERSRIEAREWREEEWRKNDRPFLEGDDYDNPYVIDHTDGSFSYPYMLEAFERFLEQSPGMAMAHLLVVEQQMNPRYEGGQHIWTTIKCQSWTSGVRFLAIPEGATQFKGIRTPPSPRDLLDRHWEKFMRPVKQPFAEPAMYKLIEFGDAWFTEYPKVGARMDTADPEFLVTKRKRIGLPVRFRTSAGAGFFFKYDLSEISQIAPPGANGYRFTSDVWREGQDWMQAEVQFYSIEVDTSQRLIRDNELGQDYVSLLELMDAPV